MVVDAGRGLSSSLRTCQKTRGALVPALGRQTGLLVQSQWKTLPQKARWMGWQDGSGGSKHLLHPPGDLNSIPGSHGRKPTPEICSLNSHACGVIFKDLYSCTHHTLCIHLVAKSRQPGRGLIWGSTLRVSENCMGEVPQRCLRTL